MIAKRQLSEALATVAVAVVLSAAVAIEVAAPGDRAHDGQTLYVPVYSHIYSGNRERPVQLAVTVSIRNTDPRRAITVETVDYYDSEGAMIESYLDSPFTLDPLATLRYVVKESNKTGGSGANFMVSWRAESAVNPPLVEGIMISTSSQLGISFASRAVMVHDSDR